MAYLLDGMETREMTDIYERLADENEPAPATAPAAQLTGDQASELIASPMAENSDATAILAALAGPSRPTATGTYTVIGLLYRRVYASRYRLCSIGSNYLWIFPFLPK